MLTNWVHCVAGLADAADEPGASADSWSKRHEGQSPIIGLGLFAERLRLIWQASRNDDPYADWWLIKVHEAIEEREALFLRLQRDLDERLTQMGSIEVAVAESERPYRMPLQFANPYAYQAARLVSTYDTLVCAALTAGHIGVLDRASRDHVIELGARKIRGLFMIPQGYRFLRIERSDIQKDNDKIHRLYSSWE